MSDEIEKGLKEIERLRAERPKSDFSRSVHVQWLIATVREQMAWAETLEVRLNQRSLDLDDAHAARLRAEKYRVETEGARKWEAVAARERIEREIRANERAEAAEKKLSAEEEEFIAMRNDRDYAEKACAAMRAALEAQGLHIDQAGLRRAAGWCSGRCPTSGHIEDCEAARAALATDAGKDWVPRVEFNRVLGEGRDVMEALADTEHEFEETRAELERAVAMRDEMSRERVEALKGTPLLVEAERQRCAEIVRGLGGKPEEELPGWNWVVSEAVRRILGGK